MEEKVTLGMGLCLCGVWLPEPVWVPHVDDVRVSTTRAHDVAESTVGAGMEASSPEGFARVTVLHALVPDVAESAVGASAATSEKEGFVRAAIRARHANLLRLFRRRFLSLVCLV